MPRKKAEEVAEEVVDMGEKFKASEKITPLLGLNLRREDLNLVVEKLNEVIGYINAQD